MMWPYSWKNTQLTLFPFLGFKRNDESFFIGQPNSKQAGDLQHNSIKQEVIKKMLNIYRNFHVPHVSTFKKEMILNNQCSKSMYILLSTPKASITLLMSLISSQENKPKVFIEVIIVTPCRMCSFSIIISSSFLLTQCKN